METRIRAVILAAFLASGAWSAQADSVEDPASHLDSLYRDLQEADPEDVQGIESEIAQIESHSGSVAMDYLLARGEQALNDGDTVTAIEHFTALIELAPDFAEGWSARSTAYFMQGEYGLAIADIRQTLILNPRHFGVLAGLGVILEDMDNPAGALQAYRAAQAINPYLDPVNAAIARLEKTANGVEL